MPPLVRRYVETLPEILQSILVGAAGQSERYFREQYALWRHAFEAGAENGCIVFREAVSSASSRSHECAGDSLTGTGPA